MTIASTDIADDRKSYTGSGTTGPFNTPQFLDDADIRAVKVLIADGTETELALTTDFTLTGAGDENGGTLTLVSALTASYRIEIFVDPVPNQEVDYAKNDGFPAESHETALDRLTMLVRRALSLISRSLVQPDGDSAAISTLPGKVDRASLYLAFDADGDPIASSGTDGVGAVPVSVFMETLLDDTTAAAARATIGAVGLTGDETVAGVKTFSDDPVITGGSVFRKNAIINGDFNVWQRGTSFAAIANGAYAADRWLYNKVGAMVHTLSRSTDVPTVAQAGRLFNYSLLVDCTTADAAIAASDLCTVAQSIEGYNWLPLAQRQTVLSFWVKATKTGTYCVALSNSGRDRSFVREFTVNAADTWELKTVTFDASPSSGTWDYTTSIGARVIFTLAAGTDFQGVADAWNSADDRATANQVNACDSTSNDFRICGVQFGDGSVATEFEHRTYEEEYRRCRRYYQNLSDGSAYNMYGVGFATSATDASFCVDLNPPMRAAPTISSAVGSTYVVNDVSAASTGGTASLTGAINNTPQRVNILISGGSGGLTLGRGCTIANNNSAGTTIELSAEI